MEAVKLYLLAKGKTHNKDIKDVLDNLSKTEEEHFYKISYLFNQMCRPDERINDPKRLLDELKEEDSLQRLSEKLIKGGINNNSSAEDIIKFAINEELEAQGFYRECMGKTNDANLKIILHMLVKEEEEHENTLRGAL